VTRERGLFAGALIVGTGATVLGVPIDFVLFALTLAGVALFHHRTLQVALIGLAIITLYKLGFTGFKAGPGLGGLALHMLAVSGWHPTDKRGKPLSELPSPAVQYVAA